MKKNTTDSCQHPPQRPNPTSRARGICLASVSILRHRQAAKQRRRRRGWPPMSTTSGSPGTPSRGWPSARGHSSGSPGTPSRRRASARGHNGGRALDSEAKMEEESSVHAQKQIEKMKRVAARALDRAVARTREAATRSLDKAAAYAEGAISGSLNESLLMPQSTWNSNVTPTPSSAPTPAIGRG
ncbi:hypothetical protein PVAP13_2KG058300 [Panicum virgatum]|uniref:Uncharacterized protein n=1 Tax=Panicum virgatum TaxID=38727 RepID=A0A8T0VZ05_PANVG|nr:hypothetical protein PVAP13_2KG058300 [Panicum virgatum]